MGKRLKNIAVLMTALDSDGQAQILDGIRAFGKAYQCNIAVFVWFTGVFEKDKHNLGELNIINLPDLNLFDGVIVLSTVFHMENNRRRLTELLDSLQTPVVCVGARLPGHHSVGTDNYRAMRKLIEHFVVDHGVRRIHFVKGVKDNPDAERRFQAYLDVLAEHGIPVEEERITQGDFYVTGGELAAREILASKLQFPEAIICANDVMAITVCDVLKNRGYRIPEDVAVSGYDCTMEGQMYYPKLTTVRSRFDNQGWEACRMLHDICAGIPVSDEVLLADEMVLGESCGCVPTNEKSFDADYREAKGRETFQRKLVHRMIEVEKNIMEGNEYADWVKAVRRFITTIEPKEFYCCVNENFLETVFRKSVREQSAMTQEELLAYTENVEVSIAYRDGSFIKKKAFPSKYAFDELFEEGVGGKMYVFSPVHYLDHNFGYFVFVDSEFPINNILYVHWLINMGDSIENIRKQNLLQNAMAELEEMYIRDSLTGAYNRFGMERISRHLQSACEWEQKLLLLAFADLDDLKTINDTFGHASGDRVIRDAVPLLKKEGYYVIRYGGDEFLVLGMVDSAEDEERYCEYVREQIDGYNAKHPGEAMLSLSLGCEIVSMKGDVDLEECIRIADNRMYEKKAEKKRARSLRE